MIANANLIGAVGIVLNSLAVQKRVAGALLAESAPACPAMKNF